MKQSICYRKEKRIEKENNLKEINIADANKKFKESILRFDTISKDDTIYFSNYVGFRKYFECKIDDLDKEENIDIIKNFHYMAINLNQLFIGSDLNIEKLKNSFACLIDIDANNLKDRDLVIKYALSNYSGKIISIATKSPEVESKHRYGAHILIYCYKDLKLYKEIHRDFIDKFDCVDKYVFFACVKNPMYKYFRYLNEEDFK